MRAAALLAAAGALLLAVLLGGGASGDSRLLWLGGGAALAAAVAAAASFLGVLPRPSPGRFGAAFLAFAGGFVLWNGVTIGWSVQPDRSWDYTNRGLAYLAFAALGLFLGAALPRAPRRLALLFLVGFAAAIGWALLGKGSPRSTPTTGGSRACAPRSGTGMRSPSSATRRSRSGSGSARGGAGPARSSSTAPRSPPCSRSRAAGS